MGLELLAISLGLSTFQEQLSGRKVVIHSDNSGSEVSPPPFMLKVGVVVADAGHLCSGGHKEGHGEIL